MVTCPAKYYTQTSRGSDISERTMSDSCVMVSESGSAKPLYSTQSSRELQDDLLDDTEKGKLYSAVSYKHSVFSWNSLINIQCNKC